MAGAVVQAKTAVANTPTTPASITLDSAATAGNTLVVVYGGDGYVTSGNKPSGFTEPTGARQETFLGHYVWYRVAAGGETTITCTPGSAVPWAMCAIEVSGVGALDVSNGQLTASAGSSYTTPAVTPSAGARFGVASIGGSSSTADITDLDTWLSSYTEAADIGTSLGSGTRDRVGLATRSFTADGVSTESSGATYTGPAPQSRTGIILVFQESTASSPWTYGYDVRIG